MSNFQEQLFGSQSFLQFTLANDTVVGKPSITIGNNLQIALLDRGVLSVSPQGNSLVHSILLSVAVHGNETAPIEIIDQLVSDIFAGKIIPKHRLLIVIANPEAIKANRREVDENMNRLFSPSLTFDSSTDAVNSDERQRSQKLMAYSREFFAQEAGQKIHYDLHTAIRDSFYKQFAVSPNTNGLSTTEYQYDLLGQWGIEAILSTAEKSATYSAFTANHCDATSFTLELGKVKPFGENDLEDFAAVITGLEHAISGNVIVSMDHKVALRFKVAGEVLKQTENFRLCFPSNIANFTQFEIGEVLATDKDYQYIVKKSGERILFPNENVAIGQRALVIIRPL
jgi:succinylglutamate desuccinylase|tara:strand:- start:441 stop:1463 length:1023 start_codon:yes stop_codon:yes gene_type:complete